ncbi:TadE/TadG family type IV pilus assembly protein [Sphingomonas lenta]|uniref:Tight adherence protein TadE n=1 Tax=Sphingomonas lenta TaxID=1141887 RepID=A0A2A2SGR1_9SPHN|nr:TadE/TadG family type IV pilus assembly protein [Sphingomonas lenta]PAX08474.1 tight adherence protein TadE [Sphingomonas lenta]
MSPVRGMLSDARGVAFVEFALSLPLFLVMLMGGAEVAHYMTTRMRVSQLALHVADHAARIGDGDLLAAKLISERQINDLLTGAGLQSAELDIYGRGRVILSSLQEMDAPNPNNRFEIKWQRCRGSLTHTPEYGEQGATDLTGMGPAGNQVTALPNGATMFVEIRYDYRPLLGSDYIAFGDFTESAAMAVRNRRNLQQIAQDAPPSSCS